MERWRNKTAVVTGASSGIGAAIAKDLVKAGLVVVGLARRVERVEALSKELDGLPGKLHARVCDVSKRESIDDAFDFIEKTFGGVDILINNAGIGRMSTILSDDYESGEEIINTNLFGLVNCTKAAFRSMQKRDVFGHVINVNSIMGHHIPIVPGHPPQHGLYAASKYGVTAITETIRQELNFMKNKKIKVSSISPGIVNTEIMVAAGGPSTGFKGLFPMLESEDISSAVLYMLGTPEHVQVQELIIKPVGEPF